MQKFGINNSSTVSAEPAVKETLTWMFVLSFWKIS